MIKKIEIMVIIMLSMVLLAGCGSSNEMHDGFYTAEMSDFEQGWKEYVCILVKNDTIVTAEFNAKDESGFIKSWDNNYMKNMNGISGTYPNEYTREYVRQLIEGQSADNIDTLSGATSSGSNFVKLASAVIEQAKVGNAEVVIVKGE